jgi:hypothetical protein
MKRSIIPAILIFVGFAMTGCYKDVIMPDAATDPDGPAQPVSFQVELAPMLKQNCADVGCHVKGSHKPYLENLESSHSNIVGGGFVNTEVPKQSILYQFINGEMKEYIPSAADRQKVYDWIRNGAPNN